MAAPGIGDVLTAIQLLYSVYKTCKDAPEAVQDAMVDVKQMRTELESMERKVNDPKSFVYKNKGKMLARVKETFEPLISGLETMTALIQEYRRIPPYSGQKLLYSYMKVPLIKDVQASFARYRDVYSSAFQHIGAEADAHNAAQLDEMAARNAQLEKDLAALKNQQRYAARLQKDGNAKMDQLLKGLEGFNLNQQVTLKPVATVPPLWEAQLRSAGLKDEDVKRIMAALKFDAIPPINITPSPGTGKSAAGKPTPKKWKDAAAAGNGGLDVPKRPRASSQPRNAPPKSLSPGPEPKTKRAPSPSPSTNKPPSPHQKSPSPKQAAKPKVPVPKKLTTTEHIRILCVDRTNGLRSTQSQAYLSLIRLWTANTSTPPGATWLFRTVSSVGLNRPSPLATSAQIPIYPLPSAALRESALTAIAGAPSYFRSDNHPFEKEGVLKRVRANETRGILERDFETFDFMLCFNGDVLAELENLVTLLKKKKRENEIKAKVVLIPGTEWYISSRHTHVADVEEVTGNLKKGLKNWLTKELCWNRPPNFRGIMSTVEGVQGRTLQIVLPGKYRQVLVDRIDEIRAGSVKEVEGCYIRWEGIGKEGEQLISITGRKEKLKEAEAWVRGLC